MTAQQQVNLFIRQRMSQEVTRVAAQLEELVADLNSHAEQLLNSPEKPAASIVAGVAKRLAETTGQTAPALWQLISNLSEVQEQQ